RESVDERFVLEPAQRAVLRAEVSGAVLRVATDEGARVSAGQLVAQLQNLELESAAARANADYGRARAHKVEAELKNASFVAAENESKSMEQERSSALDRAQKLQIASPISGIVLTPHLADLQGSYLVEGSAVAEVADTSSMRAQIYVPEEELQ